MKFTEPPPPPTPLETLNEDSDRETLDLLREASMAVSYLQWKDKLSLADFRNIKKLALAELWGRPDVDLAGALKMTRDEIAAYPELPEFAQVKEALIQSFDALATPKSMEDHVKDLGNQDALWRKLRRDSIYSRDDRAIVRLTEALADRAMPVLSQKSEQRVLIIRESQVERMQRTQDELAAVGVEFEVLPEVAPPNEPVPAALLPPTSPPKADDSQ